MGCCCSSPDGEYNMNGDPVIKNGSMLMGVAAPERTTSSRNRREEFQSTKGGSLILGRRALNGSVSWQPGQPIVRPKTNHKPIRHSLELSDSCVDIIGGYKSLQGRNPRPPHKPNQDSLLIDCFLGGTGDKCLISVFDGHGPFGEHASHYCRMNLSRCIATHPDFEEDPVKAFNEAFPVLHEEFVSESTRRSGVDPTVSGSTCVSCLIHDGVLHTANIGDSRAILVSQVGTSLKCKPLTIDHKPQRVTERERLEMSSAVLYTEREVRGFGDNEKIYVCRERDGEIIYGVLFTRSIGDLDSHTHLGIVCDPEISTHRLTLEDRFIVLASDGVWDHLSNETVMRVVACFDDPQEAANMLVDKAKRRWDEHDPDHRRDDVTAVVIALEWTDGYEPEPIVSQVGKAQIAVPQVQYQQPQPMVSQRQRQQHRPKHSSKRPHHHHIEQQQQQQIKQHKHKNHRKHMKETKIVKKVSEEPTTVSTLPPVTLAVGNDNVKIETSSPMADVIPNAPEVSDPFDGGLIVDVDSDQEASASEEEMETINEESSAISIDATTNPSVQVAASVHEDEMSVDDIIGDASSIPVPSNNNTVNIDVTPIEEEGVEIQIEEEHISPPKTEEEEEETHEEKQEEN